MKFPDWLKPYPTAEINIDELPKHTIMCSCRRCVVSIRTYVRRLRELENE